MDDEQILKDQIIANLRERITHCKYQFKYHICEMDDKEVLKLHKRMQDLCNMMQDISQNWNAY